MNIIVMVIDTLRYDYIGVNGNNWIHTPNIDELASKSWIFDHYYCASYPTIPNRIDMLTGRYGQPFHPWRPLPFDVLTLPRVMAEAGYCTQLIHDTPHLINGGHNFDWPFHAWTFIRGAEVDRPWIDSLPVLLEDWQRDPVFDVVDEKLLRSSLYATYFRANRGRKKETDWNTARLFLTASQWLKDNASRDNFFLWIDCFDPHEPWDVPSKFVRLYDKTPGYDGRVDPRSFLIRDTENLTKVAKNRIKAFYAAKVSWVDRWLGEFLGVLDEVGLAKNTVIILTSDHGTNVGEHSRFGKGSYVREQEGHIPLFICLPNGESGRSSIIVQPQDIFATIMSLVGLSVPNDLESHNILAFATQKEEKGPREVALSGNYGDNSGRVFWNGDPCKALFTVFDNEWSLEFTAQPQNCRLTEYGSLKDVASCNSQVVERLRTSAIDEIERRGADSAFVTWLRSEGKSKLPDGYCPGINWPHPKGFVGYWNRLYSK